MESKKNRVSYFYDNEIGSFYYGNDHPMKPFRIKMAHQLIVNYGLYRKMNVYQPHRATNAEMQKFHSPEYIEYLNRVMPTSDENHFSLGFNDCPVFDGLFDFSQISCGGSIGKLSQK
jgi:histone deacetylase 1/2